jgi:hypothetical protein
MMDVVIVYESIFGNTRMIAEAVADGVREADPGGRVAVLPVADATPDNTGDAALVIVGGPTHVRGMSRASGRQRAVHDAAQDGVQDTAEHAGVEPGATGPGVREWLGALPRAPRECKAAAFDTRLRYPLAGGAAGPIAKGLRRHGYAVVASPAGFIVEGAHGPLASGERDRARAWGRGLASSVMR